MLYGKNMKMVSSDKYLGDQISGLGSDASVSGTIAKRKGKVIQTIFEIRAIIDDCRSHVIGAIQTGLEIWEMAVLPYLTNNSATWYGMSDNTLDELDSLQKLFYRVLLQVPTGCPIPMLYWDCGGLLMSNIIIMKKLILLHHIATLSPNSYAHQIYLVQKKLKLPGLVQECEKFLVQFNVTKIEVYTKLQWKLFVKKHIKIKNKADILERMKPYDKIDHKQMATEKYELKPYFKNLHLSEARDKFRIRSYMTRTVKMNFKSHKQYASDLWTCWHCPKIDSQAHVMICPEYEKFRTNKNLENDSDLVTYFREVLKFRDEK